MASRGFGASLVLGQVGLVDRHTLEVLINPAGEDARLEPAGPVVADCD